MVTSERNIVIVTAPGPQGAPGALFIDDKPIVIGSLAANDILIFDGTNWINTPSVNLTMDGGIY